MLRSVLGVAVDYADESHPGLDPTKQLNEDSCGSGETPLGFLAVLCDGMGGHSAGEVASRTAVKTVLDRLTQTPADADVTKVLHAALEEANAAVCAIGKGAHHGRPGSTCVSALLTPSGLRFANVGDSRAYLARGGQIQRCTRDHSVVGELVAAGAITPEQAAVHPNAHHITRALGMNPKVVVDVSAPQPMQKGDIIILCSDGLTDLASDADILSAAQGAGGEPVRVANALVKLALERGGHDNVTIICMKVMDVVDTAPTIVDTVIETGAKGSDPLHTLVEGTPHGGPPPAPPPTVVDGASPMTERPKVAPTMVDHHTERATPIVPFPPAGAAPPAERPQSLPPDEMPNLRRGNTLVAASAAVVLAILVAIVMWAVAR